MHTNIREAEYNGSRMVHQYVPVEDGTRLSVVLHIPTKDGIDAGPLPVVFQYTPYNHLVYKTNEEGNTGIICRDPMGITQLVPYGYVVAFVHVRGCAASFGVRRVVCSRQEARDGAWMTEWLAAQSFCNGKVMTAGQSYNGQTQLEIISQKPEHLVASYIGKTDFNRYDGWVRNGIARAFGSKPDTDWGKTPEEREAAIANVVAATVPVDGDEEKVLLRQAIEEHVNNGEQCAAQRDYKWRDSYSEDCNGEFWKTLSASTYLEDINASGAAVYLDGGTLDVFKRDTLMLYHNLTLNKKLIFGPWDHVGPKKTPEPWTEMLRWADYWLKGIENGVMEEKPIALRVMEYDFKNHTYQGEGTGYYRYEDRWPIGEGRKDWFYLSDEQTEVLGEGSKMTLTNELPKEGSESYRGVFGIQSSVETWNLSNDKGTGARQQGMNYFTEPFAEDREYIGHPMAKLSFVLEDMGTMEQPWDLDFFVGISDYDPDTGETFQFTNGWLRSSLRKESDQCPYNFLGLPWHENKMGSNEYLVSGQEYHLNLDIMPVFYRMRKGHRLMVTITNSLDRTYYYGRDSYEKDSSCRPPKYRLMFGGEQPSCIMMPDIYEKCKS